MEPNPRDLYEYTIGILIMIIGFFTGKSINEIGQIREANHKNEIELEKYKAEAANIYAKDATIERIHTRIDESNKLTEAGFKEIRTILLNNKGTI